MAEYIVVADTLKHADYVFKRLCEAVEPPDVFRITPRSRMEIQDSYYNRMKFISAVDYYRMTQGFRGTVLYAYDIETVVNKYKIHNLADVEKLIHKEWGELIGT